MADLAARFTESRIMRAVFAFALASIVAVVVFVVVRDQGPRRVLSDAEIVRAHQVAADWLAASASERCPRAALREPAGGDGSPLLERLFDKASAEHRCLQQVWRVRREDEWVCGRKPCPVVPLAELPSHPEIVDACAPLYDTIARVAASTAACSPLRAAGKHDMESLLPWLSMVTAVRLRLAPMVTRGEIATAARHTIDAMRVVDDFGRSSNWIGASVSSTLFSRLAATLDELLLDSRLAQREARAIVRDLDVLLATRLSYADIVRQEAFTLATDPSIMTTLTGDPDQDRAFFVLIQERWLREFDRLCRGKDLRHCAERLDQLQSPDDGFEDYERILRSGLRDSGVAHLLVEGIASGPRNYTPDYLRMLGRRDFALTGLRMQAALRTDGIEVCRARVASGEAAIMFPRWLHRKYAPDPAPRALRCIERSTPD
jgi:hypothetical protein